MTRTRALALATVAASTGLAHADTFTVDLRGTSFFYGNASNLDINLVIDPGDTVDWNWISGFHNVVSGMPGDPDVGSVFDSGSATTQPGVNFSFTFNDPGTYFYFCEPHAGLGMISSVVVTPAPSAAVALLAGTGLLARRRR